MITFIGRHAVILFAVTSALLGLGMGAVDLSQIHDYETHQIGA